MKRLWAACLMIIGLNTLVLAVPHLVGQTVSDVIVLTVGAIDLIAAPVLVFASLKMYRKKSPRSGRMEKS